MIFLPFDREAIISREPWKWQRAEEKKRLFSLKQSSDCADET